MTSSQPSLLRRFVAACGCAVALSSAVPAAQSDLDAFMKDVVAKRDDNWKKLQQYILDERETVDLRGPMRVSLWGEQRDYTWYIRDGFFVRSPVKVNGVTIPESDRREAEARYLKRAQERDKRRKTDGSITVGTDGISIERPDDPVDSGAPAAVDGLLKQTRQPGFVSSAYFMRFKFEQGKYALVGRETLDGRQVLRVEYYPTKLFGSDSDDERRREERRREREREGDPSKPKTPPKEESKEDKAYDDAIERAMNKVSLVTLWVEPKSHQIVKYTFDNLPFDFLPGEWLLRLDTLHATMTMSQPFPDVWLPQHLEFQFGMSFALGPVDMTYAIDYRDYRQPDVAAKVKIK